MKEDKLGMLGPLISVMILSYMDDINGKEPLQRLGGQKEAESIFAICDSNLNVHLASNNILCSCINPSGPHLL